MVDFVWTSRAGELAKETGKLKECLEAVHDADRLSNSDVFRNDERGLVIEMGRALCHHHGFGTDGSHVVALWDREEFISWMRRESIRIHEDRFVELSLVHAVFQCFLQDRSGYDRETGKRWQVAHRGYEEALQAGRADQVFQQFMRGEWTAFANEPRWMEDSIAAGPFTSQRRCRLLSAIDELRVTVEEIDASAKSVMIDFYLSLPGVARRLVDPETEIIGARSTFNSVFAQLSTTHDQLTISASNAEFRTDESFRLRRYVGPPDVERQAEAKVRAKRKKKGTPKTELTDAEEVGKGFYLLHHRHGEEELNTVPIGPTALQKEYGTPKATAVRILKFFFGGYKKYEEICADPDPEVLRLALERMAEGRPRDFNEPGPKQRTNQAVYLEQIATAT